MTKINAHEIVYRFYLYLLEEVEEANYRSDELSLLNTKNLYYGRYINPSSRNYFTQTVIPILAQAVFYFNFNEQKKILDIGCGLGMQSLIFASCGAKVIGIDIREDSISLCKKRKIYYENKLKRNLDLDFVRYDIRYINSNDFYDNFDCAFSMSAFSYIRPLQVTASKVASVLKENSKILLYERNKNSLQSLFKEKRIIASPQETVNEFKSHNFDIDFLYGGCSLPSYFWKFELFNFPIRFLNNLLRKRLLLSFNYVLAMKRS